MIKAIQQNAKGINRALLFIGAIALVIYILPREAKFMYEYSHGEPWRHSTLIAPFDFPIYKTSEELEKERENAIENFNPYFNYNNAVTQTVTADFKANYNSETASLEESYNFLTQQISNNSSLTDKLKEEILSSLQQIYAKGVITLPSKYEEEKSQLVIMLIKDNFVEAYELNEFLTYQKAYTTITNRISQYIKQETSQSENVIDNLINDLQLNRYIEPNITFNENRTNQERDNIINDISLTSGIVLSGQRIVDTGELITGETGQVIDSLKKEYETRMGNRSQQYFVLLGQSLIIFLMFSLIFLFLMYFRTDVYNNLSSVLFLLLMVVSMVLLARMARITDTFPIYIIPFAILPIIVRIFFDSRLAFFLHVTTILIAAFFARNSFEFVFLQIPAGLSAMFSLFVMVRRSQLVRSAIFVILTYSLFYTGLTLWQGGDFSNIQTNTYWQFIINGGLLLLIYPLIYIFEKLFGFLSDVTLVELADTNHPVLRRLAEKAPGTFQHSIQVGNLAQEAVYKIGGNPLLVRAGAMYHDIGKTGSPLFFTENQTSGINPHADRPFEESSQIIIHHVESGVKMAQKEKLPKQIIDFIKTHHGTMKTGYFYNSWMNANPSKKPDMKLFTYPGPAPFTKETAVLMMADSVEAASRSLKSYKGNEIDKLVEKIIDHQITEKQFDEAPITLKEISRVKDIFKIKLKNIYHARVEYPKLK
ncbi:HDIG domain-containing protein [Marinilabiliaceae bacterium ANBcel2]|nr:HDIG domain-containing protein [Marinilabiliaceae bacterium ANBcel2]